MALLPELQRLISGQQVYQPRTQTVYQPTTYNAQTGQAAPVRSTLNAGTRAATGGGGVAQPAAAAQAGGGGGVDEVALAEAARRNRINSYKAQAKNVLDTGVNTFNDLIKAVGAFRDRSKVAFDNSGQEIINRSSEILGQNARTAQDTMGEARARGRALGLGDSSKFINQNKVAASLAATQGNTIARRGEEDRANAALLQERNDQAQSQENEANTYLRDIRQKAANIENTGYDVGEENFANSLNDIVNYQRSLSAMKPLQAGNATAYAPNFNGIVNTINSVLSNMGINATGDQSQQMDASNPVAPTTISDLLKRRALVQ